MGVDHAGQHEQPAGVDLLPRRAAELGPDGDDAPIGHREVALVAADEQVEVAHRASPRTKRVQHVERHGHVGLVDGLVGVVADPARAAHEEHRDAGQLGERHRVVPGAAGQRHHRQPVLGHRRGEARRQRWRRPRPPARS